MERVFALCRVTKFVASAICSIGQVFADRAVVFTDSSLGLLALLCSSLHETLVRKNASASETRLTYTPTDAFSTLPHSSLGLGDIKPLGADYAAQRERYCKDEDVGLTDFYNAFRDQSRTGTRLSTLRAFLADIDRALLNTYGRTGLYPEHGFHEVASLPANGRVRFTISEAARL